MSQISDVYNSGLFATLAYANFSSVVGIVDAEQRKTKFKEELANKDNGEAFNDKFLTAKQAKEFADHYELFDYKEYSATGFAATVFRETKARTLNCVCPWRLGPPQKTLCSPLRPVLANHGDSHRFVACLATSNPRMARSAGTVLRFARVGPWQVVNQV